MFHAGVRLKDLMVIKIPRNDPPSISDRKGGARATHAKAVSRRMPHMRL
jgi:hypothetical protein